jgi:hypothetical protein
MLTFFEYINSVDGIKIVHNGKSGSTFRISAGSARYVHLPYIPSSTGGWAGKVISFYDNDKVHFTRDVSVTPLGLVKPALRLWCNAASVTEAVTAVKAHFDEYDTLPSAADSM